MLETVSNRKDPEADTLRLRSPTAADGAALWELVREAGTLDLNSSYAYLLLADRFRETCVIAEDAAGHPRGFLTGFIDPSARETFFLWQIGVHPAARGQRLASQMIDEVLARPRCRPVMYLETTVSPSNEASAALFRSFARRRGVPLEISTGYAQHLFPSAEPGAAHEAEPLYRIGPFSHFGNHYS